MAHLTEQFRKKPSSNELGMKPVRMDVSEGLFRHVARRLPDGAVRRVGEIYRGGRLLAEIELSTGQLCHDTTFYGALLIARDYISRWEIPSVKHSLRELRHA